MVVQVQNTYQEIKKKKKTRRERERGRERERIKQYNVHLV